MDFLVVIDVGNRTLECLFVMQEVQGHAVAILSLDAVASITGAGSDIEVEVVVSLSPLLRTWQQ